MPVISLRSRSPRTSAAPDGAATTASESEASRDNVRSGGTHDECSPALRAGCAPAGKVLASLGHFPREGLLKRGTVGGRALGPNGPTSGQQRTGGTAGSHPRRSSGCQARHPCRLIAPGCATCRRLGFRVINPPRGLNFRRLPQPIRRLLLLAHPSDLELPGVDLLAHQSEANSLPLRVALGTTDEHVDVGHAPPSLPSDPDWCRNPPPHIGGCKGSATPLTGRVEPR